MVGPELQLHQFDFHALVEFSVLLHRARLSFQRQQLLPGGPAAHAALQQHHGRLHAPVRPPGQPPTDPGLEQHGRPLRHKLWEESWMDFNWPPLDEDGDEAGERVGWKLTALYLRRVSVPRV